MGLEAVEFFLDVEKAFGLSIPDHDANSLTTGRKLVSYLFRRMPEVDPGFGTASARWTLTEIEQVVEGLIVKHTSRRGDVSLEC